MIGTRIGVPDSLSRLRRGTTTAHPLLPKHHIRQGIHKGSQEINLQKEGCYCGTKCVVICQHEASVRPGIKIRSVFVNPLNEWA